MTILDLIVRAAVDYVMQSNTPSRPEPKKAEGRTTSAAAKIIRSMSAKEAYFDSDKVELAGKIVAIVNAHQSEADVIEAAIDKLNELKASCRFSSSRSDIYNYILAIATHEFPVEV